MSLQDDSEVVIHMGTGVEVDKVLRDNVIANYDEYRRLLPGRPDRGAFVLSTFAVVDGVTEREIVNAMLHNKFARARYGDLRDEFEVYPTSIVGPSLPARIMAVHFDIVIPDDDWVPQGDTLDELTPEEVEGLVEMLRPGLTDLIGRFTPQPPRENLDKRDVYPDLRKGGSSQ